MGRRTLFVYPARSMEGLSAGCLFHDAATCKPAFENLVLGPSRMNPHTLTIGETPTGLTVLQAARACRNSEPSTPHNGRRTDMATSRNPSPRDWTWRELYVAALMEADDEKMSARIAQAERAILDTVRELFYASADNIEEEQALDDALYALRALKSCLELHGGFAIAESQGSRPRFLRSEGPFLA
jgi:hypothetical protein